MTKTVLLTSLVAGALTGPALADAPATPAIKEITIRPGDPVVGPHGSVKLVVDVVASGAEEKGVTIKVEPGSPPGPVLGRKPIEGGKTLGPVPVAPPERMALMPAGVAPPPEELTPAFAAPRPALPAAPGLWGPAPAAVAPGAAAPGAVAPGAAGSGAAGSGAAGPGAVAPGAAGSGAAGPGAAGPGAAGPGAVAPGNAAPGMGAPWMGAPTPAVPPQFPPAPSGGAAWAPAPSPQPTQTPAPTPSSSYDPSDPSDPSDPTGEPIERDGAWETWRFLPSQGLNRFYPAGVWTITATARAEDGTSTTAYAAFNLRRDTKLSSVRVTPSRGTKGVRVSGSLHRVDPNGVSDFAPYAKQRLQIFYRRTKDAEWQSIGTATTGETGQFERQLPGREHGLWRVRFAGTEAYAAEQTGIQR